MHRTLMIAFTTMALVAPVAAGDKLDVVDNPKLAESLWQTPFGKELAQRLESKEPAIDILDPGARCDGIDAGKHFFMPRHEQSVGALPFAVEVTGDTHVTANADRIAAEVSFGPSAELWHDVYKPIDLRATAATTNSHENAVALSIYAFGYELETYSVASTPDRIHHVEVVGWTLPDVLTRSFQDSFQCDLSADCLVQWAAGWAVIADVGALYAFDVGTDGVEVYAATQANARGAAAGAATAQGTLWIPPSQILPYGGAGQFLGTMSLLNASFAARARLVPHDNRWVADAGTDIGVTEILGAHVVAEIVIPALGELAYIFDVSDAEPASYFDQYAYQCTFEKAFR